MSVIGMLEAGRSFAERIPYSLLALVSRFAIATSFQKEGMVILDIASKAGGDVRV